MLEEKKLILKLTFLGEKSSYLPEHTPIRTDQYYMDSFRQGADLMPRRAVMMDIEGNPRAKIISIVTAEVEKNNKNNKPPWDAIDEKGTVESKYVFATLKSDAVIPFMTGDCSRMILPLIVRSGEYEILTSDELAALGDDRAALWFRRLDQKLQRLGDKTLATWLRRKNKLIDQSPDGCTQLVVYGAGGSNVCAAILDTTVLKVPFINDQTLYVWPSPSRDEAMYVCGMLNSEAINIAIKGYQPSGQYGEQHVHKLPLSLIPRFDKNSMLHVELSNEAGRVAFEAQKLVHQDNRYLDVSKALSSRRKMFYAELRPKLEQLNILANKILQKVVEN